MLYCTTAQYSRCIYCSTVQYCTVPHYTHWSTPSPAVAHYTQPSDTTLVSGTDTNLATTGFRSLVILRNRELSRGCSRSWSRSRGGCRSCSRNRSRRKNRNMSRNYYCSVRISPTSPQYQLGATCCHMLLARTLSAWCMLHAHLLHAQCRLHARSMCALCICCTGWHFF